jgi:predicted MFS family arabinose efflux permease
LGELAVAGILPPLAADLHVSIPAVGQLVGGYALAFAVLTPPLAAAFGGPRRKRGLLIGLIVVAVANLLACVAPSYVTLLAARFLAAAGSALVSPLALGAIDDVIPVEKRGWAQGVVFSGFSVAATIGVPMGALIADRFDWRVVFAIIAVTALLAAILCSGLRLGTAANAVAAAFRWSQARRAVSPAVLRILAISLLSLAAQYATFTYMRPYLAETGSLDLNASAFLLFLLGLFGSAGNLGGGLALDRYGPRGAIIGCLAANIGVFAVMRFVHAPLLLMAPIFIVWAVSSWACSPAINHSLAAEAGDQRDLALALNMTAFNLGIAGGSALGGLVIATSGIANIVVLGAALLAAALAFAATLPRALPR